MADQQSPAGIPHSAGPLSSANSFAGADVRMTINGVYVAFLQGVSWTITREKAPNYVMGFPNPVSFSRGKRGIAGSLIFAMLNQSALLHALTEGNKNGYMRWPEEANIFQRAVHGIQADAPEPDRSRMRKQAPAGYVDQLMPLNAVLYGENEYGAVVRADISGMEILNAGTGVSIDDITIDENYTFVCTDATPWYKAKANELSYDQVASYTQG